MPHKIEIDRSKLHPWLDYKLGLALKDLEKKNIFIIVTCGYRSSAEQDKLYSQGRSKSGNIITNARGGHSQHNWGLAIDIAMNYDVNGNGKITDDTWNYKGFKEVSNVMKKRGLAWGGDWHSIVDNPHFYLPKWGDTPTKLINKYATFANFKKTWTGKVKCNTYLRKTKLFDKQIKLTIPKGKKVDILWGNKLFTKVRYDSKYGYIRTKNLDK